MHLDSLKTVFDTCLWGDFLHKMGQKLDQMQILMNNTLEGIAGGPGILASHFADAAFLIKIKRQLDTQSLYL